MNKPFIPHAQINLGIPSDETYLIAAGKLACAAGTHEVMLVYLCKQILEIDIESAFWATQKDTAEDIRKRCRKSFISKVSDQSAIAKLDSLLNRSRGLMDKRNLFLHRGWGENQLGQFVSNNKGPLYKEPPSIEEIENTANELQLLDREINLARLDGGYLSDAIIAARRK